MSAQYRRRLVLLGTLLGLPGVFVVLYTVSRLVTLATIYRHDFFWQIVSAMMIVVFVVGLVMLAAGVNVVQAALRDRYPVWPTISW